MPRTTAYFISGTTKQPVTTRGQNVSSFVNDNLARQLSHVTSPFYLYRNQKPLRRLINRKTLMSLVKPP